MVERFRKLDDGLGLNLYVDELTRKVCVKKVLKIYDLEVFRHLKEMGNKHVAVVYDYEQQFDGSLVVFEEYIPGHTLRDVMKYDRYSRDQKIKVLGEICEGLEYLHSIPVVHHDLKPDNIMITDDGLVKIIDFDAAKIIDRGKERDTILIGTVDYAAPEQYGFGASDEKTDIYSLGCIIKEWLPGDAGMNRVIRKAMSMDPKDRYENVGQLRREIRHNGKSYAIPGFRSGILWKKVVAILCYIGIVAGLIKSYTNFYSFITLLGVIYLAVDIATGWTGLGSDFPGVRSSKILIRIIAKFFAWLVISILYLMVAGVLNSLIKR